jgi:hypothetical protein
VDVARDLVGLHGTAPGSVFLAARARLLMPEVASIERAMCDERTLVRMLGMRRTMFVVPVELMPVVQAACTRDIAKREPVRFVQVLAAARLGGDDPAAWLRAVEDSALRALDARGQVFAGEIGEDDPRLREQLHFSEGKKYEGFVSVSTRVLLLLAADGRIVRGRPRGSWTSSQYSWSPIDRWLPGGVPELPSDTARVELVRQWLRAFGPGTIADLRWWTGLTGGEVTRALAGIATAPVELEEGPGVVLAEDVDAVPAPEPWVALLPSLDPTLMGWTARAWYLGEDAAALFDRSGNPGPTIWCDGRIVGGWAQRRDGEVAYRRLEDMGTDAAAAVRAEAERLREWLGPIRATPLFRTPLEKELSA